jgi:hypothetical protein
MSHYHIHSYPAIIGGIFSGVGSCALLLSDVGSLSQLSVDKALMPVLVGITVLTGHLALQAWHELKLIAASGLALISLIAGGFTVTDAMGRRAEVRDTRVAGTSDQAAERAKLQRKLAEATEILAGHRTARDRECASGKGRLCDGKSYTVSTWEAAVAGYETRLRGLPAPAPVDAKGERIGAVAALLGYSKVTAQAGFGLLEPFMLPALLELASIVLFGFGVRHSGVSALRKTAPAVPTIVEIASIPTIPTLAEIPSVPGMTSVPSIPKPVGTPVPTTGMLGTLPRFSAAAETDESRVLAALAKKGGSITGQRSLSLVLGVSPAETCRMLQRCHPDRVERLWDPISKSNVIRIRVA